MKKLFTILALTVLIISCGDSTQSPTTEKKAETDIEEKLAVIDDIYDQKDIKAVRIRNLVNVLATKYSESKDTIGEYTYRVKAVLQDKGIDDSILTILEQMNKQEKMENTPYKDAVTMYLLVRANQ